MTDIPGWFTFAETYNLILNQLDSGHIVEVGCFLGASTVHLQKLINEKNIQLDVVDFWPYTVEDLRELFPAYSFTKNSYETFLDNVSGYRLPTIKRGYSEDIVNDYEDHSLDFVFIDAAHDYENVRKDIINWRKKIKKGGIIAGDDYNYYWSGVIRAVDELMPDRIIVGNTWIKNV